MLIIILKIIGYQLKYENTNIISKLLETVSQHADNKNNNYSIPIFLFIKIDLKLNLFLII